MKQGAGRQNQLIKKSQTHLDFYSSDPKREAKMKRRERQQFAPHLDALLYGRKYLLPNYRQPDYHPQEIANKMTASSLLAPLQTFEYDDVANAAFCNTVQAMKHGRPQLWLERELAEAFMRTQLPEDMEATDLKWRWPGFRVHLPRGILTLKGKDSGRDHELMFMDLCTIPARTGLKVPEPYAGEIRALATEYNWPNPRYIYELETTRYDQTALMISGNLDGPLEGLNYEGMVGGDFMLYAVVKPFDQAVKLGQIRRITNLDSNLSSPYEVTESDNAFCERMLQLGLNILLFLGSTPLEYRPEEILRKPRLEGRHQVPGLYRARFVGASQLRADRTAHIAQPVSPTGRQLPQHWVAGHWKRQVHGIGRQLRKYIWLQPYQTHGPDEPEKEPVKQALITPKK